MKGPICAALAGLFALAAGEARATCVAAPRGGHYVSQNETVPIYPVTTSGSCVHGYRTYDNIAFESLDVAVRPKNGRIVRVGTLQLAYIANKGFKGTDSYVFRLCGTDSAGKGCSMMVYTITVK